jgi:hypothetical protein
MFTTQLGFIEQRSVGASETRRALVGEGAPHLCGRESGQSGVTTMLVVKRLVGFQLAIDLKCAMNVNTRCINRSITEREAPEMSVFRGSNGRSSSRTTARRFAFAASVVALVCGMSSPKWCLAESSPAVLVADTGNFRLDLIPPSDLKKANSGSATVFLEGLASPVGVAVDSSNNVWISVLGNMTAPPALLKYTQSQLANLATNPNPVAQTVLSGSIFNQPGGLAFDSHWTLWTADQGRLLGFNSTLLAAGSNFNVSPSFTITSKISLSLPKWPVFDKQDNMWLSDVGNSQVFEFGASDLGTSGDKTPAAILSNNGGSLDGPGQLTFDKKGRLWVPNTGNSWISVFGPEQLVTGDPLPDFSIQSSLIDSPVGGVILPNGNYFGGLGNGNVIKVSSKLMKKRAPKVTVVINGLLNDPSEMGATLFPH